MSIRYTFDELNRLIVTDPRDALRPRRILEGRLATDDKNHLLYEVDSSATLDGRPGPRAFSLDGTWKLTQNHQLALALHEAQPEQRQTVYLKGALIAAQANALVFALHRNEDEDAQTAQRLTLSGRWQADAKNRLTFLVEKADGSEDRLTLQGGWEVGEHHELLYRYRQLDPTRRAADQHAIVFDGAWDITRANRLVYRLAGSSDSAFEFKVALRTPSLVAREGRIAYQIGIGLSGGRTVRQRVALFGTWKLNRDLSVSFEIPYADGRISPIRFEGTYALSPRNRVAVALRNREREGLGLTVVFTRELIPDAKLFLRLEKDALENSVVGGVQVRF